MTDAQLAELEALEKQATPGPWITGSIPWKVWANGGYNTVCDMSAVGDAEPVAPGLAVSDSMAANRDLIAAMRNALPDLLAELREGRAEIASLTKRLNDRTLRTAYDATEKLEAMTKERDALRAALREAASALEEIEAGEHAKSMRERAYRALAQLRTHL